MGQKLSAAADALLKESWQQEDEAEELSAKGKLRLLRGSHDTATKITSAWLNSVSAVLGQVLSLHTMCERARELLHVGVVTNSGGVVHPKRSECPHHHADAAGTFCKRVARGLNDSQQLETASLYGCG
jgi:hypothetical protein